MSDIASAIIVTFNPDAGVQERIKIIAEQVDRLYVVDNTPTEAAECTLPGNAVYFANFNKGGLAGALNIALKGARAKGYKYHFVFDQDTDIGASFCGRMMQCLRHFEPDGYGIFGPRHINASTGYPVRLSVPRGILHSNWPQESDAPTECMFLINSCSVLDLEKLPGKLCYDEDLGVDMIDVAFGLQARKMNVKSLCIPAISVIHGIGNRRRGAAKFAPTNYNSDRKYLQTRNRVIIWKRFFRGSAAFVLSDMLIWAMDSARTIVLESDRRDKARSIIKGVFDGLAFKESLVSSA